MKPSIRQLATAAIALSLLMNGKPSHGEAVIPDTDVGIHLPPHFDALQFWIGERESDLRGPHEAHPARGMVAFNCDYHPGDGPCYLKFDGGRTTWRVQRAARYTIAWDKANQEYCPKKL